jgi:hypothetical protein
VRNSFRSSIYLTLDFWDSRDAYEKFTATHKEEYKALDAAGEKLARNERRLGWYETVEP